jgi:hypothetical protein
MTPDGGDEISFQLYGGDGPPSGTGTRWLTVRLDVGGVAILELVSNLLAPRSTVRTDAFERLKAQGLVATEIRDFRMRARTSLLRDVRIGGRSVPDVEVRVREDPLFRRTDGYLGQDFFFRLFAEICFNNVPSL